MSDEKKAPLEYSPTATPRRLPMELISGKSPGVEPLYLESYQRNPPKGRHKYAAMGCDHNFFSASFVPAPLCDECRQSMVDHSDTHWVCKTEGCLKKGIPVHTGVYPIRKVRDA